MKKLSKENRKKIDAAANTLAEVYELLDGLVSAQDDYISERSEKWQEGDAASDYESWKSEFEEARDAAETARDTLESLRDSPQD